MGPILSSLSALQAVEHDLAHVRRRLHSKQSAVLVVEKKIADLESQRKVLSERLKLQQAKADEMELERASREEEIVELRAALNKVKTNKEYAALLTQINSYKADNSKVEDQTLKLMEQVDTSRQEIERIGVLIENEQKRLDTASQANAEEVAKLNTMLEQLQEKRDKAASQVDPDILHVFNRIADKMDGEGMAEIEATDARKTDFVCGGCYMSLSAEHYSALMSKDEIRRCDTCGRILYINEAKNS